MTRDASPTGDADGSAETGDSVDAADTVDAVSTVDAVDTVAVTGGNGTVGRAAIERLDEAGYRTVNLNRGKRDEAVADAYLRTDLLDAGDVYGSMAKCTPDAVVHLGMIPNPEGTPEHTTFESNATSTYLVLEAARALDVERVALASSLSALGAGFEDDPVDVSSLPLDEDHPLTPTTPYGLGKQVLEVIADGFGRRAGPPRTVSSLRFPWVTTPSAIEATFAGSDRSVEAIREAGFFHTARNTLFSYLHSADAARAVQAAVEATFEGHERFWLTAPDTTTTTPTETLVAEYYPDATLREEPSGTSSLVSSAKAARLLDWSADRTWRGELSR